jgi:hypothetical protein
MSEQTQIQTVQKVSTIWSSKRECQIAVKIQYQVRVEGGCRIYKLSQVEELA